MFLEREPTPRAAPRFSDWCRGFEVRHTIDILLQTNFETKATPESIIYWCPYDFEIRLESDIVPRANFEIETPGGPRYYGIARPDASASPDMVNCRE